jgi:hypothetical protein
MSEDSTHPPGAYIIQGQLFFVLKDGSIVTCNCIKEPFASQVVEACNRERHTHE